MENNNELSARQSLAIINETLDSTRRAILRGNAKYFLLWGLLLTVLSLVIFCLWHSTGNPAWNWLWFLMPVAGYPVASVLSGKDKILPQGQLGSILGLVWAVFAVFSLVLSVIAVLVLPFNITLVIVVLLGLTECVSGVVLKSWPILVSGFILGVGGAVAALLLKTEAQLLLFTLGGVLLALTGLVVKFQYR